MAIPLPDARQLTDEVLEALRLRALHGREAGFTEADLAELLGVSREAVCRWWSAYAAGGLDAIPHDRTGRPAGSGRLLSDEQARRVQRLLDETSPGERGIPAPLWNRRAVGDLIRRACGVRLAVRTVGKYLRRWGYTPKRPTRRARGPDPAEVRRWLEETYPAIEERATREGATIYWCDETGARADAHPGTGYAREGRPVTMEVPDPHLGMTLISAVSNAGEVRFMTYAGAMDAALFLVFLGRLLRGTTGTVFLIVDRRPAHWPPAVREGVAAHSERLGVVALPRRAPERNPDEYLNNDLKGRVNAGGLPESKQDLRSHIQGLMRTLLHLPDHIRSYFRQPDVQYAAAK